MRRKTRKMKQQQEIKIESSNVKSVSPVPSINPSGNETFKKYIYNIHNIGIQYLYNIPSVQEVVTHFYSKLL